MNRKRSQTRVKERNEISGVEREIQRIWGNLIFGSCYVERGLIFSPLYHASVLYIFIFFTFMEGRVERLYAEASERLRILDQGVVCRRGWDKGRPLKLAIK